MKLDILIISHFCGEFDSDTSNRFNYIAEILAKHKANVELITSQFSHTKKQKRSSRILPQLYKVTFIYEPSYKKNVSLRRFYSHYMFGKRLSAYLQKRTNPDIIYCAIPSLDAALAAGKYAKRNNIKFIIDIQDLWPEAFKMIFKVPIINNIVFFQMKMLANYIYKLSDVIIAVSNTYISRAMAVNEVYKKALSIYIGTDMTKYDNYVKKYQYKHLEKNNDEVWIVYSGTLGHSYDLCTVIKSLSRLKVNNHIKFIVIGDGPKRKYFEKYGKMNKVNIQFVGYLPYEQMVGLLSSCDIAVNPIIKGSVASIINKHADYAAAGLPVINSQECIEYRKLLNDYNCGLNCKPQNVDDMVIKLERLVMNKSLREEMSKNSRILAEEKFNRNVTYKELVNNILFS